MPKPGKEFMQNLGRRLRTIRRQLNYNQQEMASALGLKRSGYFKNEEGETFPGVSTLFRLQKNYDISMDWLIFNKGPMVFKEKQQEEKPAGLEERSPEVRELVDVMEQDPQLKHEILAYFYKYKSKKKPTEA
ncbi:MAG: helix-turn-helix domain-containing protein [Candidatus Aminicenantes bacterium]|nr:helix-turn-helix domain-containing protein [Candidatus Aminicenantes bacterium]NIM84098.1 helix-turn-helix domain-containing protein [Candidatus Aminicenantes bacterium]NIN23548.1 helix-turn-helix domain-containing protein [Candidatus Aminicenantes bacterium]NIN47253.1 helix-turn-helix domain-containing protein [Candidatus Aminicenantes bacterium]NIN90180.1 helix-turn-helix domain-containing protein [Candidatus Aminicenantes bacterium]